MHGDIESTRPLVDLVLSTFQAVKGSKIQLDLTNMIFHNDKHFHVPVTISPVLAYEPVENMNDIAPLD